MESTLMSGVSQARDIVVPVKSFYGVTSAKSKDSEDCPAVSVVEKVPSGTSIRKNTDKHRQLHSDLEQLPVVQSGTQHQACRNVVQKKSVRIDRRPKSIERAHTKAKLPAGTCKSLLTVGRKQLVFKTLENAMELEKNSAKTLTSKSTKKEQVEKENKGDDHGIKRFFKNRQGRKHVMSVAGRRINVDSLSSIKIGSSKKNKVSMNATCLDEVTSQSLDYSERQGCEENFAKNTVGSMSYACLSDKVQLAKQSYLSDSVELKTASVSTSGNEGRLSISTTVSSDSDEASTSCSQKSANCQTLLGSCGFATMSSPGTSIKRKSEGTPNLTRKDRKEQMILDFGQKLHGTVSCASCGMTYARRHPDDELMHSQHHRDLFRALQFTGRNNSRVVQDYPDGNCVVVVTDDDRRLFKRIEDIKRIVDKELGYVVEGPQSAFTKTFLYISQNQVTGFCLAQPLSRAYRMQSCGDQTKTLCCSEEPVAVRCGISRIWVLASHRRKGVATHLLDVIRSHYLMGYPLSMDEIAFSDPTPEGAKFAAKYCQTDHFLVYNKNCTD